MSDLKPFQIQRGDRGALVAFKLHNMVNSKCNSIVSKAESKVLVFKWNGKNNHYTIACHISSHRSAHNDMVGAEYHIGYQSPNEYNQVQSLLKSIEYIDIRIKSAITTIFGDTIKRGNFKQAADFHFLAASVHKNDTLENEHHISSVNDEGSDDNTQDSGFKGLKNVD